MTDEKQLDYFGLKYGTDKVKHGYIPFYAKHLPKEVYSLLEIGCCKGASLRMWNAYFGADCDIHTIDLFKDRDNMSVRACRDAGFVPHEGDQSDIQFLSGIKKQFAVVVDDGSHRCDHMLITFKHLFVNNLVSGGQYYIEDLEACREEFYYAGEVKEYKDTALAMFIDYAATGDIENVYFNKGESEVFQNLIDRVEIDTEKGIVLIVKK